MALDASVEAGQIAHQTVIECTTLLHDDARHGDAGGAFEALVIEVLPQRRQVLFARRRRPEVQQTRRPFQRDPFERDDGLGRWHGRRPRPVLWVARRPAAIDEDTRAVVEAQRHDRPHSGPTLMLAVVEPDQAPRLERAAESDAQRQASGKRGEIGGSKLARRRGDGRVPLPLQRQLGVAAALLPLPESDRRDAHQHAATDGDQRPRAHGPVTQIANKMTANPLRALMKIVIAIAFIGILAALAAALVFLMRDKGGTNRTVNALTVRVSLSVALLLIIWFCWWMGWIEPRSY